MPKLDHHSHHHQALKFPKGFLWGSATSAYQVEGGNRNSDWEAWRVRAGQAVDHYHRYEQDFEFIKKMHNSAHRLSIEWSRIQPRADSFDSHGIDHYRHVLKALKENNITTFVTLHHFTNPIWFAKLGGWANRRSPELFNKYVELCAKEYGDLVDFWLTINEPMIYITKGYFDGTWPPGKKSLRLAIKVLRNLEKAHRASYQTIHSVRKSAKVGYSQNIFSYQLYRPHNFWDQRFMNWLDSFWNHGFYRRTADCHDFIGLNYYFHYRMKKFQFKFKQFFIDPREEQRDVSDIGWEVFAPGLTDAIIDLGRYKVPIYITENGIASDNDDRRVRYLLSYLKEVHAAIEAGADVRGYFYWSLLDNFEWEKGFGPRFGLVEVDYQTLARRLKASGKIYGEIAQENGIEHGLLKYLGHGIKVKV